MTPQERHWTQLSGAERLTALDQLVSQTIQQDASRIARIRRNSARYEIRSLSSLSSYGYSVDKTVELGGAAVRWPIGRMGVKAGVAKIGGTQQPKVQFVTSNADWSVKRKARQADQFIEGLWSQRQEPYSDIWELGAAALRDAFVCGDGYVKVISDEDAGKVPHERVLPEDVFHPHAETRYGAPQTRIHRWDASRTTLGAWYPEKSAVIDRAPMLVDRGDAVVWSNKEQSADRVEVREVWRLPDGPEAPGRHVLYLVGTDEPLLDDPWTRDSFPICRICFDRALRGMDGCSLMDESAGTEYALNELLDRVLLTVRRTGINAVWCKEDEVDKSQVESTVDAAVLYYTGQSPPRLDAAVPFAPAIMQLLDLLWQRGFEVTSQNQMNVTAQKQPGITANSALLTLADIQSELFSVLWRAYQQLFVDIARQDIYAVRDIVAKSPKFAVKWKGASFLKDLRWKELDLQDDQFVLAPQSAPSTKGTAAGRLQSAEDLYQAGGLTLDALLAVRTYFDTQGEVDRVTRQRELMDRTIERWLDATPEQMATGMYDTERRIPMVLTDGLRWMRLEDAIVQVADGYFDAVLDDAPDGVKHFFLTWLSIADQALQQKQQAAAAAQQAAAGGPAAAPAMSQAGPEIRPGAPGAPLTPGLAA